MDLNTNSPLRYQFMTLFLFRRAVYASIFMFAVNTPFIQVGTALITVVAMAFYLLIVRPYQSVLSQFLSIFNELMLLCTVGIPGRFLEPVISPDDTRAFGNALIGLTIATIVINWVAIIVYGVTSFI